MTWPYPSRLWLRRAVAPAAAWLLAGCGSAPVTPERVHLSAPAVAPASEAAIPAPVVLPPPPPEPSGAENTPRYTVVVRQVPVQELLQAVARDARVNIDIHPAISGVVSLNAVDQTLPQILQRITRQTNARYRIDGPNLIVEPDTPFLRTYQIDYVNATRNSDAEIGASSQVSALSTSGTTAGGGGTGSSEKVTTSTQHHFWTTLIQNLKDLLREGPDPLAAQRQAAPVQHVVEGGDGPAPGRSTGNAGSGRGAAAGASPGGGATAGSTSGGSANDGGDDGATEGSRLSGSAGSAGAPPAAAAPTAQASSDAVLVIANPETGVISVRATSRQHERVQDFLEHVMGSARREVLIEATVVEVTLSDNYKAGIDWSKIGAGVLSLAAGDFAQNAAITTTTTNPGNGGLAVRYANGSVSGAINLLDTFGNTRVLSSPKLMTLNNQTALLKVVDNLVYFNITSQFVPATNNSAAYAITTATPRSVSVGLTMAVTPQISQSGTVSLIVRPTISRVLSYVADPSTTQNSATVTNLVPQIEVREIESILSVQSGQIAVLGGLMQQSSDRQTTSVPGLGQVPTLGELFKQHNDTSTKTELVVFLRPVVVDRQQPIPPGAASGFPDADFFQARPEPQTPQPLQPVPLQERRS